MTRRPRSARRWAATLGLFAVLFQAVLFGWHHHVLSFAGWLSAPVVENPAATPQLADDEDSCEICQVLHHLTAAPVDTPPGLTPLGMAAIAKAGDAAFAVRTPALAFHARAPPRLTLPIG